MKTLLRNFTHNFRRFLSASILNLLGLSVAFAAFFVIMTQVDHDYNYNKGIKEYENIFQLEIYANDDWGWGMNFPRPMAEKIAECSPHIKAVAIVGNNETEDIEIGKNSAPEEFRKGFGNYLDVFQPEIINGSLENLKTPDQCIIPESKARFYFGRTDVAGKTILTGNSEKKRNMEIVGVYRDYPKNTLMDNKIFTVIDDQENKNVESNWNYRLYLRLDAPSAMESVSKEAQRVVGKDLPLRFISLHDTHFSDGEAARSRIYLLFCASLLIVIVAAINFTNFSLAETPMRIRSINTQKVLGASTLSLRGALLTESVIISLLAFLLSLFWIANLPALGLQDLVEADLVLSEHPLLLAVTLGLSLLTGLLAGLYPAWYVTSFPPALALKGSFGLSPKGKVLRTGLVCLQYLVTFVLVICVGIMYLQSHYIHSSDYGYDKQVVIIGKNTPEGCKQLDAVRNELSSVRGVEGVAFSFFVISSKDGYMTWGFGYENHVMNFTCLPVDPEYFKVMGIRITEGRAFRETDNRGAYVFNEAAHKKYPWLQVDKPAVEGVSEGDVSGAVVTGFCENIRVFSMRSDNEQPFAFFHTSKAIGDWPWQTTINVRIGSGVDKIETIKELQKRMEKFTPNHDFEFKFMDEILDNTYHQELRFTRQILLFSLLAIVISLIGVFCLTMFESEYRRKEIGIRKIMGSTTREILLMFNKHYIKILAGCFVVAVPLAWWLGARWLESFTEHTSIAWWLFLLAFILVAAITFVTVTYQSWKNATENPVKSIKTE